MTDDQHERLNRFLAERVMGWTEGAYDLDRVYRSAEGIECFVAHWNPLQLMRDCTLLLDKIEQEKWYWDWDNATDGGYGCAVWNHGDAGHGWSKDSRTEALCLAIAHAYGWEEEA